MYKGLQDRLVQDDGGQDLGQVGRVILPPTHKGGPCHMHQLLQDSPAICREYKKPDLFLTITANGTWPKITENLFPGMCFLFLMLYISCLIVHHTGQSAVDRPDLVTCVFHVKQQALLRIVKDGYFGAVTILFPFSHIPSISSLVLLFQTYSLLHQFSHTGPYSRFHHHSSSFFLFPF